MFGTIMLYLVYILCAVIITLYLKKYYVKYKRINDMVKHLPSPKGYPIIGNALIFFGNTEDILNNLLKLFKEYESLFYMKVGPEVISIVYDPHDAEKVLTKALDKPYFYEISVAWVGRGLFTAPVEKWRRHRKVILPTFNPKILQSFVELFAMKSEILVDIFRGKVGKDEFDVFPYISRCTLDSVCETVLGVKIDAQTDKELKYVKYAEEVLNIHIRRMIQFWMYPDWLFRLIDPKSAKKHDKYIAYFHNLTDTVIKQKKEEWRKNNAKESVDIKETEPEIHTRRAFLELLIDLSEKGSKWTDQELREEVDTIMIAGNDTTANVNSFTLMTLAMQPDIQDKVYEELYSIYGDSDRSVTSEDLTHMIYLEQVIKETMRIFPPGPFVARKITKDLRLENAVLPADSTCIIPIIQIHRDPETWPDPEKFDPDRFLPEESAKRHPYAFIPFSGGPRNCIGNRYAMMSVKTFLSTILRQYKVTSDEKMENIKLKVDVFLKPVNGYNIKLENRTKR